MTKFRWESRQDLQGMRRWLFGAVAFGVYACAETAGPGLKVAFVTVKPTAVTLVSLGQTTPLTVEVLAAGGAPITGRTVVWASSNPTIVMVSAGGVATALANGVATVTASVDSVQGSAEITVAQALASMTVSPSLDTLVSIGASRQMSAIPKDALGQPMSGLTVVWTSINTGAVTVNSSGMAQAVQNGSSTIEAAVGAIKGSATLHVVQKTSTVVVTPAVDTIAGIGATRQMTGVARDANGNTIAGKTLTWSSTNTSVATVSNSGLVTSVASGSTTIAGAVDGKNATASIVVAAAVPVQGYWAGLTSQNYLMRFKVVDQHIENLASTLSASLDASTLCIAVWPAASANIPVVGGAMSDSLHLAAFNLSRKISASGTFTSATRLAATVKGYTGAFNVDCGSNFSGSRTLWSDQTIEARPLAATDANILFAVLSTNYFHTCGVSTTGAGYCWGAPTKGKLGNGQSSSSSTSPSAVSGGLSFSQIAAGYDHTCGITTTGAAYCWGDNTYGQIGDGTTSTTGKLVPTAVSGGLTFKAIGAGFNFSCGLTTAGALYCWGWNAVGQLGDGTTTDHNTPTAAVGARTYNQLSVGGSQSCAVDTAGTIYCWHTTPTAVTDADTYISVSTQSSHTCAVTTTNVLKCWGNNSDGQIGDGTSGGANFRTNPVQVATGIASVTTGFSHTCATTTLSEVKCWGSNVAGRLGVGDLLGAYSSPTPTLGGVQFSKLTAGNQHTCGISLSNVAYCWGLNVSHLGTGRIGGILEVPFPIGAKYP